MPSRGARSFSTSPPASLTERKGPGCVQINGALMGRQAWSKLPAGSHLERGRTTLRAQRAWSSLPAGASVSASGKWTQAQVWSPRFWRRVLGSPAQGRTLGVWKPACSGSGARGRDYGQGGSWLRPRGIPSLGPQQTDPRLQRLPAASLQGRALWIKYIHIYIFNCQSLLSRKGQRALGPPGGRGLTQLPGAGASRWGWRLGPSEARRQTRVSLLRGSPRPASTPAAAVSGVG